jgi:hypothetical protein
MPMPPYPLICYQPGCGRPAVYKIAARWSDGLTGELKTYGLCCESCLPLWYGRSTQRQRACRLAPGEVLEVPSIFLLTSGRRDRELKPLTELEQRLNQPTIPQPTTPSEQEAPPPT